MIEARIGLGQLDAAETLLQLLERSADRTERSWARASALRCRALLLAARGDLAGARIAVGDAVAMGRLLEHRLELARSLLAMGEIDRRGRHRSAAIAAFHEARAIFMGSGARLWALRVDEAAQRTLARRTADAAALTLAELRTAELARTGLTNREIASVMFVSSKTVEANLSRAFSKLGIQRRGQLPAGLGPQPTPNDAP